MLGFNKYGSYGWVLFENLKGLVEAHQSNNLEMRGYYRGCIATLAGEMTANQMKMDNIEFSTEIYEKQVDRVRRLVDGSMICLNQESANFYFLIKPVNNN